MHIYLPRPFVAAAALVSCLLLSASPGLAATSHDINGASSGTSTEYSIAGIATCNPQAPTSTSDLSCAFNVQGNYHASHLGSGTYSGQIIIDYAAYTSTEPCGTVTGTITFTSGSGTISTTVQPGSTVCDTTPPSTTHLTYLILQISTGTGRFADASGIIYSTGTSTATQTPGLFDDQASISGTIAS